MRLGQLVELNWPSSLDGTTRINLLRKIPHYLIQLSWKTNKQYIPGIHSTM